MFRRYHDCDISVNILTPVSIKTVRFLNHVLHPDVHDILDHTSFVCGCETDPYIVK